MVSRTAELVGSTADAAYATDGRGRILAWNRAATELLGYEEEQAVGAYCWEILCGADLYGNRLCRPNCWVTQALRHHEALHRFPIILRAADGSRVCAQVSLLTLRMDAGTGMRAIIHVLTPYTRPDEAAHIEPSRSAAPEPCDQRPQPLDPASVLTGRELEILHLLDAGSSTQEIAHTLFISVTTVRNHIQHILAKLGAHSRLAAVSSAARHHRPR